MGLFGKKKVFDSTEEIKGWHVYRIRGKSIACPHCGNVQFEQRTILLNTPGMTFFGLEWANKSAAALICSSCSQIQWFLESPEVVAA
ncbi:MAG: hypothetical protein KF749_13020 [Bacteroidetes bacterium]|nr:hypothetical protein [Bacteroidota bacterium]MCW5894383.1 hypothetical protein [Bacteroidota bacterium]